MTKRSAEVLLAAVIIARSTSFLFSKIGLGSLSPLNLLGVRFGLAFIILAIIFHKRLAKISRRTLLHGAALGGIFFGVMAAETFALTMTDSSTTSFLENTAVVIVPLMEAFLHRRAPDGRSVFCILITLAGVALLTLRGGAFSFGTGEVLCLAAALLYACAIILTDRLSHNDDALMLGVLQVGFLGLFAFAASFAFETPQLPQSGAQWAVIAALAIVCTCFGYTLQPVAQKHTSAELAGQFCALSPLSASMLGVIFLNERPGLYGIIGAALILSGIVVRSMRPKPKSKPALSHTAN